MSTGVWVILVLGIGVAAYAVWSEWRVRTLERLRQKERIDATMVRMERERLSTEARMAKMDADARDRRIRELLDERERLRRSLNTH